MMRKLVDRNDRSTLHVEARAFLAAVPPSTRSKLDLATAERWALEISRRVGEAHPSLGRPPELFAFVGARLVETIVEQGPEALHIEDLALAWGCLEAESSALEKFDLEILRPIVRRAGADADVAQRVREKLWVGRKLEEYAGRGPLIGWTRMVVRRQSLNDLRQPAAGPAAPLPSDDVGFDDRLWALANPEMLALRQDARAALKQALSAALAALPEQDRELLRLHHLEGVPHGEVGKRVGLPRSTVAFRLERARERLLAQTRAELRRNLGEQGSDVDSIIRAVQSDLDLSLSLLRPRG